MLKDRWLYLLLVVIMNLVAEPPPGGMEAFSNAVIAEEVGDFEEAIKWYRKAGRIDTTSTLPWEKVAELSGLSGNYLDAMEAFEKLLDVNPLDWEIRSKLARIYLSAGMYQEARIHLEELVMQRSEDGDNYLNLANVYLALKMEDDARMLLDQAKKRFSDNIPMLKKVGDTYMQGYMFEPALDVFNRVLREEPDYIPAHLGRAIILEQTGRADEAEDAYEDYFDREEYPKIEVILSYLALIARQNQIDRAISLAGDFLELYPESPQLHKRMGFLFLMEDKKDESLYHLQRAAEYQGQNAESELYLYIADIYGEQGNIEAGIGAWQEYLEKRPGIDERIPFWEYMLHHGDTSFVMHEIDSMKAMYPDSAVFDFFLGTLLYDKGILDSARSHYEIAIRLAPENTSLRFALGDTYERLGLRRKAIQTFKTLVSIDSETPMILNYLGYILADSDTLLDQSRSLLEKALRKEPQNGAFLDSYGWLLFREGKPKEALDYLKKAEERVGDDPVIYEHLGDVYLELGRTKKAVSSYQQALDFADGLQYDIILEKIENVR